MVKNLANKIFTDLENNLLYKMLRSTTRYYQKRYQKQCLQKDYRSVRNRLAFVVNQTLFTLLICQ
ncbi:hypothetical protein A8C56_06965 [Niabella ginsenosidivorans]|uniref:Uncharacterized protein n=1 Tax=Niabella ginsenosidivorans TaxID=1176587 RepID=A0A1A9HZQ6_9BACT|nr:hypothetical protein A8C56_06965 [Niabella ginsenosidivorans]